MMQSPHSRAWIRGSPLKDFWGESRRENSQGKPGSKPRARPGVFSVELERASDGAGRRKGRAEEAREGCWELEMQVPEKGIPTCDLWGLHHSFLEEGFCLCEGQESLWRPAQTLVPRGSLR